MGLKVIGIKAAIKALKEVAKEAEEATNAAIYEEGLDIAKESVKIVPVDTGRLRSTHYVAPPDHDGVVEVGYGTDYALAVHERVEVFHEVGQPLFLKTIVDRAQRGYVDRIATRAEKNMRNGVGIKSVPRTSPTKPKGG